MGKIFIPELRVACFVGVPDEERRQEQDIWLDVELTADLTAAGRSDDFDKTIDYEAVCKTVETTVKRRTRKLIETIAEEVAEVLLGNYPVEAVKIRVRKPSALQSRGVPYAAVEVERRRDE